VLLALGVLFGTWVSAAHGQVPSGDSVVGQGRIDPVGSTLLGQVFDLEATSGPSGEDPSGHVALDVLLPMDPFVFHVEGPVTCLSVSGNDAVVGFDPDLLFPGALIEVEDNGPPASDPPDRFLAHGVEHAVDDPSECVPTPGFGGRELAAGDLTVADARVPTSKQQCEHGGWRDFPGFKNQGQCVAFVQRGPR
jgi:hypothetical protein